MTIDYERISLKIFKSVEIGPRSKHFAMSSPFIWCQGFIMFLVTNTIKPYRNYPQTVVATIERWFFLYAGSGLSKKKIKLT